MKKSCRKKKAAKRVLRLPDLDYAKGAVMNTLGSPESKRAYEFAIDDFVSWYCSEPRLAFNVVLRYRLELEGRRLSAATINLRLAAVRRLGGEGRNCQIVASRLSPHVRQALSYRWRRVGTDPIFAGARLGRDDGAISGLQTAAARCSERQNRPRAVASTSPVTAFHNRYHEGPSKLGSEIAKFGRISGYCAVLAADTRVPWREEPSRHPEVHVLSWLCPKKIRIELTGLMSELE